MPGDYRKYQQDIEEIENGSKEVEKHADEKIIANKCIAAKYILLSLVVIGG